MEEESGVGDRAAPWEGDKAGLLSPLLPSTFVLSFFPSLHRLTLPPETGGLGKGEGEPRQGRHYGREEEEIPGLSMRAGRAGPSGDRPDKSSLVKPPYLPPST